LHPFKLNIGEGPPPQKSKWGTPPKPRVGIDRRGLKQMVYVGQLPTVNHIKDDYITYGRVTSQYAHHYGAASSILHELAGDKYYIVQPTKTNIENVIRGWDEKKPDTYQNFLSWSRATQFLSNKYGFLCRDSVSTTEEVDSYINYNKSPGYPANLWNIDTKAELVRDKMFLDWQGRFQYSEIPFYIASPKKEYLAWEDIAPTDMGGREKIRLFTIPPFHLLQQQLRFGKKISTRIKNFKWSAYGFNPYKGGVDLLANRLLSKPIRFFYDVSGWDKFLPLMKAVYAFLKLNNGYNSFSESLKKAYDWMETHSVSYFIKMYDGSVYQKKYGNASGSGTTTRDNILAHILIVSCFLMEAFYNKFGCWPTDQFLDEQIVQLFGDDSVCSVDEEFDYVLHPGFLDDFFSRFGMKLKFLKGGRDFPIEEMQFLGFTFRKIEGKYFPLFDTQRLATTMIYDGVQPLNRESFICRAFMLYFMSFSSDEYDIFKTAYHNLSQWYLTIGNLTATEEVFAHLGVLSDDEMFAFYQGLESSRLDGVFDTFLPPFMEEEGFKNFVPYESETN